MTALPIVVDRRSSLTPDEFGREYYERGRPVVMTDSAAKWRAHEIMLSAAQPGQPTPYPCTLDIPQLWPELLPLIDPLPLPHALPNRLTSPLFMGRKSGTSPMRTPTTIT
jgi:hypothetical protein